MFPDFLIQLVLEFLRPAEILAIFANCQGTGGLENRIAAKLLFLFGVEICGESPFLFLRKLVSFPIQGTWRVIMRSFSREETLVISENVDLEVEFVPTSGLIPLADRYYHPLLDHEIIIRSSPKELHLGEELLLVGSFIGLQGLINISVTYWDAIEDDLTIVANVQLNLAMNKMTGFYCQQDNQTRLIRSGNTGSIQLNRI